MPRPPTRKPAPEYDAGHVPMTEEFDSAKRTLPPALPVIIALVVVGVVVAILMYANRAKPAAQGGIDEVFASQMPDQPQVMVSVQLSLRNTTEKPLFIKSIHADLKTDQDFTDEAASPSDYDRYFAAFPDLREHSTQALAVETKIAPGALQKGTVIVSFPVTKAQFDARKDLSVTVEPYDERPIVLRQNTAQPQK